MHDVRLEYYKLKPINNTIQLHFGEIDGGRQNAKHLKEVKLTYKKLPFKTRNLPDHLYTSRYMSYSIFTCLSVAPFICLIHFPSLTLCLCQSFDAEFKYR